MRNLFYAGGPTFMGLLTILLIITTAWIIYHFIDGYRSNKTSKAVCLRKLEYGKSMGLFTLMIGILGQMVGLSSMFSAIEAATKAGELIIPNLVFGGIKVTMIVTMYGILIYLFSILLWFIASLLIEKKFSEE